MVDRALHAINTSVGEGMNRNEMPILRAQSFCPELREEPVSRDLFQKTPLFDIAESLLGKGKANFGRGQIALRFPLHQDPPRARLAYRRLPDSDQWRGARRTLFVHHAGRSSAFRFAAGEQGQHFAVRALRRLLPR
jgi:hypothetical protein